MREIAHSNETIDSRLPRLSKKVVAKVGGGLALTTVVYGLGMEYVGVPTLYTGAYQTCVPVGNSTGYSGALKADLESTLQPVAERAATVAIKHDPNGPRVSKNQAYTVYEADTTHSYGQYFSIEAKFRRTDDTPPSMATLAKVYVFAQTNPNRESVWHSVEIDSVGDGLDDDKYWFTLQADANKGFTDVSNEPNYYVSCGLRGAHLIEATTKHIAANTATLLDDFPERRHANTLS